MFAMGQCRSRWSWLTVRPWIAFGNGLLDMTLPQPTSRRELQEEFNRWAQAGRGEEMEQSHLPIVEPMLALMDLHPANRVLDLGCGTGWLVRRLAALLPAGSVVGVDVSDEMIRRAQAGSAGSSNVQFLHGSSEEIPTPQDTFHKVVSVESAYYWQDPARGVEEVFRVLKPGGTVWVLINYYFDNPDSHQWKLHYRTATHLLSAKEWEDYFRAAGFQEVNHRRIPDLSPTPEVYSGRWFQDAAQLRRFKAEGALLVTGTKPLPGGH
jgi:ubiquinone/menaquinone biosynthesis C-methylase UbiE